MQRTPLGDHTTSRFPPSPPWPWLGYQVPRAASLLSLCCPAGFLLGPEPACLRGTWRRHSREPSQHPGDCSEGPSQSPGTWATMEYGQAQSRLLYSVSRRTLFSTQGHGSSKGSSARVTARLLFLPWRTEGSVNRSPGLRRDSHQVKNGNRVLRRHSWF